ERANLADLLKEPLLEIFSEAGRVRLGNADILVKMEYVDNAPVYFRLDEMLQHVELAGPGREHDGRVPMLGDRIVDRTGACIRGRLSEGFLVRQDGDLHSEFHSNSGVTATVPASRAG